MALVPLVNLTELNGPTEYLLGSQVNLHDEQWWFGQIHSGSPPTRVAKIAAPVGSVVLFDIRTLHRGTRNAGTSTRSVLYLGYVQRWYRDVVNFRETESQHTEAWRRLKDESWKALTARLDRDNAAIAGGGPTG